jgi:hypothetical protein
MTGIFAREELLDTSRGWPFQVTGDSSDRANSISNSVLRGTYRGQRAVIVGGGPHAKTQLAALLDLLHLHNAKAATGEIEVDPSNVTLILGGAAPEALDALDTLRSAFRSGPDIHFLDYQNGAFVTPSPSTFDPADAAAHYPGWDRLLRDVGSVPKLVSDLVMGAGLPSLRAYPMLTKVGFWSIRLEGLELARVDGRGGILDVGGTRAARLHGRARLGRRGSRRRAARRRRC